MAAENLWGHIPATGTLRTPLAILREQASLLGQATNNVLEGDVSVVRDRSNILLSSGRVHHSEFRITLVIVAPALDNYTFAILQVMHDIGVYPLVVREMFNRTDYECNDEASFLKAVKEILSSAETHRVIESLLSQSQAA